ncbi:MAG TPA: DUF4129 domain-containing protein [Pyrinomonadaceae bacterium]|nr:DUF4129 domain-containing protein [Pyrinomonadaceae bacterium]
MNLRSVRCVLCALLLIIVSCAGANAYTSISLAEYRERVARAAIALDSLSSFDEEISERERAAQISSTLSEVRKSIPQTLAVEWNGAPMQVNNSWLEDALKQYEEYSTPNVILGSGGDESLISARRSALLASITERLHALTERLDEVLKLSAGALSKDEEKARLAAILRRPEYNKEAQESALSRIWESIKSWLRNLFPRREPEQIEAGRRVPFLTKLAELLVIALALSAIAYAAWKFLPRFLRNRGGRRREKREARVVLGERLAPDQTALDILSEAERLARAGDIRGAIRKGYIAILCELGDRKILSLAQHKTNRDYLRALAERRPLYGEMQVLTNSFENHWYGYAPGTENDWTTFRMHYQRALKEG